MPATFAVTIVLVSALDGASGMLPGDEPVDARVAERFARLALACVHREYPNKIAHVLNGDGDVRPPRELTPAFYGCFDWHSSVHGHWLLARLARLLPQASFAREARAALAQSLTADHIATEVAYLNGAGRASFERPYGLAWLLQLHQELCEWDDADARTWAKALDPLATAVAQRMASFLPKLSYPVRSGEHSQTAFALGLTLDWARSRRAANIESLVAARARDYFGADHDAPLHFEPSGEDFLSPCLAEADVMRRVLAPDAFATWLAILLPSLPRDGSAAWLPPAVVTDPSDPKLAHLDGLNLSRAWMLEGIASGLPPADARVAALRAAAAAHAAAGLAAVTGEHYEGAHWLGSFAVYLVTHRGLPR